MCTQQYARRLVWLDGLMLELDLAIDDKKRRR